MRKKLGLLAIVLLSTACTPLQLSTWEKVTGSTLSQQDKSVMESLPDAPLRLPDGRQIMPDGEIVGVSAPSGSRCPQFYNEAINAGWSSSHWEKLDYIMWRESRCIPNVHNTVARDNSYGLLQLNMKAHKSWVGPLVQWNFNALFDAETNLRIGKVLYDKAKAVYGCGLQPWKTTKQKHWCN